MEWIIERVSLQEESVYLKKPQHGIVRKISVPGAINACLDQGMLVIWASTGFVWEVEPQSGRRRRRAIEGR
jgi:hypothetical protein